MKIPQDENYINRLTKNIGMQDIQRISGETENTLTAMSTIGNIMRSMERKNINKAPTWKHKKFIEGWNACIDAMTVGT